MASIANPSDTANGYVAPMWRQVADEVEFKGDYQNVSGGNYPSSQVLAYLTSSISISGFFPACVAATQQPSVLATVFAVTVTLTESAGQLALVYTGTSASFPNTYHLFLDNVKLRIV
jgi:hypothetical protein